jgi:hypothetical protein
MQAVDSGSEDFRSVIDDLTIENKKLKRRLRKYEKLHDAHLQSDKLFEIRMHGLPPEKKRELEATLRKFALSLEATPQTSVSGNRSNKYASRLGQQQSTSSLTSTRLADSAYASMSGKTTNAQPGHAGSSNKAHHQGMSTQNIHSYLHEIPIGLLPRQPTAMTEKAKRKLVVRRLEQLFVGKGATVDGHQQPLQQEEVAQSAARADRITAGGNNAMEEGAREARIVPASEMDPVAELESSGRGHESYGTLDKGNISSESDSPGQRPTRPLDLDPYRAQVPAENIQYMRHLGFSPPDIGTSSGLADDHGWIYLNVLTNMAQLHDINVTPGFVKNALAEHSKRLELSQDGRKVRWKGGGSLTRTSSDGSPMESSDGSPKQLGRLGEQSQSVHGHIHSAKADVVMGRLGKVGPLAYTPLFAHREDSSEESSSDANLSGWSSPAVEDISGEFFNRNMAPRRAEEGGGPIIFYNNANFCTDLSGDGKSQGIPSRDTIPSTSHRTLGVSSHSIPEAQPTSVAEPKGPLSLPTRVDTDAMEVDSQSSSDGDLILDFSGPLSFKDSSSIESTVPVEFEASGLGGIQPTDNFSINVKTQQRVSFGETSAVAAHHRGRLYPLHILKLLDGKDRRSGRHSPIQAFNAEVISSSCENLPASALPPASFFPFFSSPDDEDFDGSDADSEMSLSEGFTHTNQLLPTAVPQSMNWPIRHSPSESSCSEDGSEGDESDGSIDMLAQARLADPATIRAQEREYDGNIAERLAEEIPAGSSAATAGGGSGFNSPVLRHDDFNKFERPPLKRARPSSSIFIGGRRPKSPRFE